MYLNPPLPGKRSYLGDLEDDVEHDKDQLKEQRGEVAALKEQLQGQVREREWGKGVTEEQRGSENLTPYWIS